LLINNPTYFYVAHPVSSTDVSKDGFNEKGISRIYLYKNDKVVKYTNILETTVYLYLNSEGKIWHITTISAYDNIDGDSFFNTSDAIIEAVNATLSSSEMARINDRLNKSTFNIGAIGYSHRNVDSQDRIDVYGSGV